MLANRITALLGPQSPLTGLRNMLALRTDPLAFLMSAAAEGGIAYRRIGSYRAYLLNDPEDVRELLLNHHKSSIKGPLLQRSKELLGEGLVTGDGEHHLRQRRLLQPFFHRQRLLRYMPTMVSCTERCLARFADGQTLDLHREMMRLALSIVGQALFGDDFERDLGEIYQALDHIGAALNMRQEVLTLVLERLGLPAPAHARLRQARHILGSVIARLRSERAASAETRSDLVSHLLTAKDTDGDGGTMAWESLLDECITLLLAGHETTANALSFALYLISQHPRVEARLQAEVAQVLGDRPPTADDLPRLVYTEQVFAEAIRLYPPAWMMGRFLTAPITLRGREFAPGELLMISPYTMGRDPRFYPQPLDFRPERFTPEERQSRPRFAYFPFGAGPRQCIGEGFAWMEGTLVLAMVAQRFALRLAPGATAEVEALLTLRPKHGMPMRIHRRAP